jgi:hypothetical protein
MSQQQFTQSNAKAKSQITHNQPPPAPIRSFQGGCHPILQLQRTMGNQRVAKLIKAGRLTSNGKITQLQPKLALSVADDGFEQETDRIAWQIGRMSDSVASAPPVISRTFRNNSDTEEIPSGPRILVQRTACESLAPPDCSQGTCDEGEMCVGNAGDWPVCFCRKITADGKGSEYEGGGGESGGGGASGDY